MKRYTYKTLAVTFAIIAVIFIVARLVATYFAFDYGYTLVGCMVIGYVMVSSTVALMRWRVAARVKRLSAIEQVALTQTYPDLRYITAPPNPGLSARTAVWVGIVVVNGPILPIMLAPLLISQYAFGRPVTVLMGLIGIGSLLLGFVLAWSWWSVSVTLWRRWATGRGVDPDELQWRGENASMLWPRRHIFTKTELGQLLDRRKKRRGAR
jgi:hypothetical protein